MKIIRKMFGYCDECHKWFKYPKTRRMSTGYQDEEKNYCCVCKSCYEYFEECWQDMWDEYNSERY